MLFMVHCPGYVPLLFWSTTLLEHPFPDVRRTVQDRDALRLTGVQETNAFEIDKIQFLQIQNDWLFAALDFAFDLIQVLSPKFAAEPNPPLHRFNPQRHFLLGSGRQRQRCKSQTVCNGLWELSLDRQIVLIFQEFLFDQER
jgi:hypothetical protein